ncbi:MAG: TolC family protein [Rhodospirillaceae bacterium]|nr:TolC family protein [Rhodospirillaceae bacterium]
MTFLYRLTITSALALSLGACATVDQKAAFDGVRTTIGARVNQDLIWRHDTATDAEVAAKVDALLANEIALESAVQIALFNNRALQARYAEIGIANADLVAAGLLSNPVLDIMVRPTTNPASGANLEFGLAQSVLDIFMRPARKRAAQADFDRAQGEVASAVINTVAEVREAYVEALGARNSLRVVEEVYAAADASRDMAAAFHSAGNISDLQWAEEQALTEDTAALVDDAKLKAVETAEALAALLNVDASALKLPQQLPALPQSDPSIANAETTALEKRLDVAAKRKAVTARLETLRLKTSWRLWHEAGLAVSAERDGDKQWAIGPTLSLSLPIFDQGGPEVARAAAEVLQAENELKNLESHVRADVRTALAKVETARRQAERYNKTILPLKQDILRLKQERYNFMLIGVFDVLVAKRDETSAYMNYVNTVRAYWLARAELANAIGGAPIETPSTANGEKQ